MRSTLILATAGICALSSAHAGEDVSVSGNISLTTNYIYRGITQTDDGPAVQGGFDVESGIFYAGVWASSVDFGDDTTMEVDYYAGIAPTIGETSFDFGVLYYTYPDSPELPTGSQDFLEAYAGISRVFGKVEAGAMVSYSPDFYGETDSSLYWAANASVALSENVSASAGYGISTFDNEALNDDYEDYNLGITATTSEFDIDLRYYDTSGRTGGGNDDSLVLSLSRSM